MEKLRNNILFIHFPDWFYEKEVPTYRFMLLKPLSGSKLIEKTEQYNSIL